MYTSILNLQRRLLRNGRRADEILEDHAESISQECATAQSALVNIDVATEVSLQNTMSLALRLREDFNSDLLKIRSRMKDRTYLSGFEVSNAAREVGRCHQKIANLPSVAEAPRCPFDVKVHTETEELKKCGTTPQYNIESQSVNYLDKKPWAVLIACFVIICLFPGCIASAELAWFVASIK